MLYTCKKIFIYSTLSVIMAVLTVGAPLNMQGLQRAEALSVNVNSDTSTTNIGTLIESAISSAENIAQTYFSSADNFKEYVLDPLMWMLANTVISNMLQSLTQWVNSGFQGSPAFVTDLEGFLTDVVDEAVGEFINSTELGFLCSPFQLDVRIALDIQYQQSKSFGGSQCTLSDVSANIDNFLGGDFFQGGWPAWFELTMGPTNDPNKALLEGRAYMSELVLRTRDREFRILEANEFFLSIEACKNVDTPAGEKEVCEDSTLGNIVQDQVSDTLGIGRDRLTFADEFDELVGAVLAQFANQALMGINGMLGLGGTSYASGGYGSSGESTYLDALGEEAAQQTLNDSTDPIGDAIDQQLEYISLLEEIVDMVDGVEAELEAARNRYPSCFNVQMTPALTDARDDALRKMAVAEDTIDLYLTFEEDLRNATTAEERADIMLEFNEIHADIFAQTTSDMGRLEIEIEYYLPEDIEELRQEINQEENRCEQRQRTRTQFNSGSQR